MKYVLTIILIFLAVMSVIYLTSANEDNDEIDGNFIPESNHDYTEKFPLYYNIDDPETIYIKNSKGDFEEVEDKQLTSKEAVNPSRVIRWSNPTYLNGSKINWKQVKDGSNI